MIVRIFHGHVYWRVPFESSWYGLSGYPRQLHPAESQEPLEGRVLCRVWRCCTSICTRRCRTEIFHLRQHWNPMLKRMGLWLWWATETQLPERHRSLEPTRPSTTCTLFWSTRHPRWACHLCKYKKVPRLFTLRSSLKTSRLQLSKIRRTNEAQNGAESNSWSPRTKGTR